jgi:hypothetical protein
LALLGRRALVFGRNGVAVTGPDLQHDWDPAPVWTVGRSCGRPEGDLKLFVRDTCWIGKIARTLPDQGLSFPRKVLDGSRAPPGRAPRARRAGPAPAGGRPESGRGDAFLSAGVAHSPCTVSREWGDRGSWPLLRLGAMGQVPQVKALADGCCSEAWWG